MTARNARPRGGGIRRIRRVARLTRRGCVVLACGAVIIAASYWLGRRELVYVGSFLVLLPLLALAVVRLRPLRLSVQRSFSPAVVSVGHPTMVDLRVENLSLSRTTEGTWRDASPWYPDATAPTRLPALAPRVARSARRGAHALIRYELTPAIRGRCDIGPILVDFCDPFGLADGVCAAGGSEPLTVTPAIVPLAGSVVSLSSDHGPTRMRQRRSLGGEDDLMAREYRRGDALRRVHWRATARAGELMVRQEEQPSHAEARILLDTCRSSYRDVDASVDTEQPLSEAFEWAVSFTASLVVHLATSGYLVRMIETAPAQLASPEHPEEFLESLATVTLSSEPPEELSLLGGVQRLGRSEGSIFAVLADVDDPVLERLGAQRHVFGVAAAFLVAPQRPAIARVLTEAGWLCVTVQPGDSVEHAWLALGAVQDGVPPTDEGEVPEQRPDRESAYGPS